MLFNWLIGHLDQFTLVIMVCLSAQRFHESLKPKFELKLALNQCFTYHELSCGLTLISKTVYFSILLKCMNACLLGLPV